ncbi:TetR family transcriptional regulator [Nocardioides albidus]|uniref:TetR family transcriptional regulator n=1 Tax=Nocardioides albidus TaxID=1517589 RepID=A0A5C4W1D7_9ACTN|nr:TetR family transcriptional regulator C-terminal domain-containing protein [Nocardioides albidus]TNM41982.1 TetR family transcriptional regulator [Nocardioides albidus]
MARTRSNRRLDRPREQVLAATLEMIAEQGLGKVTMASLAARLETSGGHLLYYFGTRNGLLLETLRWSESQYAEQRAPLVVRATEGAADPASVLEFAGVFLPVDERDPRWLLWLELWARAPYDAELAAAQRELDDQWHDDLVVVLRAGLPGVTDPEGLSQRLRAMWDGFAIAIVNGGGIAQREAAIGHTRAALDPVT